MINEKEEDLKEKVIKAAKYWNSNLLGEDFFIAEDRLSTAINNLLKWEKNEQQ